MRKIGIRYYDDLLTEENFIAMAEGGMTATELCCVREPEKLDFKRVRELGDRYGIQLWSCHLPFRNGGYMVHKTAEERRQTQDYQKLLIQRGSEVGIDKFVIHPGFPVEEWTREEAKKYAMEALDELAEFAWERGARLAVENMIVKCLGNCCDELLEIVSVNDKLRICFDVNHLLLDDHMSFMERVKDKLITVHISDYDFIQERHWFPGEGKIDWPAVSAKFDEIGYEGVWMYELSPGVKNDMRSRELTVRDFYNNAMEIFAGKVPSRI